MSVTLTFLSLSFRCEWLCSDITDKCVGANGDAGSQGSTTTTTTSTTTTQLTCPSDQEVTNGACKCIIPDQVIDTNTNRCKCPIDEQIIANDQCSCPDTSKEENGECKCQVTNEVLVNGQCECPQGQTCV